MARALHKDQINSLSSSRIFVVGLMGSLGFCYSLAELQYFIHSLRLYFRLYYSVDLSRSSYYEQIYSLGWRGSIWLETSNTMMASSCAPSALQDLIDRAVYTSNWAELEDRQFCALDGMQTQFLSSPSGFRDNAWSEYCSRWRDAWGRAIDSLADLESCIGCIEAQLAVTPLGEAVRYGGFEDFVEGIRWARLRLNRCEPPDQAWGLTVNG